MKQAFLSLNIETGQAVSSFDELKKVAKDLQKQLSSLKIDDENFDEIKEKVILAKKEIYQFNEGLRVSPSFTEKLSNAIKIGMADVANRALKVQQVIESLKNEQHALTREITLTADAAKKTQLLEEFQKIEKQLVKNQHELNQFNSQLQQGFKENAEKVNGFSLQIDKNFQKTNDTITNIAGNLKSSFVGIGTGLLAAFSVEKLIEFGKESANFYKEVQKNEHNLLVALEGRKEIQEQLIEQSKGLEKTTGIDDQEIVKQQTFLALQGRTTEEIEKVIRASIALAKVQGTDLQTAVEKLDSTYEGNLGKLGKLDENFGKLTKEQLRNGEAIDLIESKYGSQAESMTDAEKASNNLGIAIEDLKEKLGGLINEGGGLNQFLADVTNGFTSLIDVATKYSSPFSVIESEVKENVEKIKQLVTSNNQIAEKEFNTTVKRLTEGGLTYAEAIEKVHTSSVNSLTSLTEQAVKQNDSQQKLLYTEEKKFIDELYERKKTESLKKEKQLNEDKLQESVDSLKRESALYEENSLKKLAIERKTVEETARLEKTKAETKFSENPERLKEELDKIEQTRIVSLNNLSKKESDIINTNTKKTYDQKLKLIQDASQNEILATESGTVSRIEAERKGVEKETEFKLANLRSVIDSENVYKQGSIQFEQEYQTRKQNIILTSANKEIELEKQKQTLLKSIFQQNQADRLAVFPEGTIERIQEQIRQAQDRLRGSLSTISMGFELKPLFNPADLVKYASEIKKLYNDLATYQASIKKTELLTEQNNLNAKLAGAKKGSDEELQLRKQLAENKKQIDLLEVNSKLSAYDAIKQAGIQLNEQELADYEKLQSDKVAITAQANADIQNLNAQNNSLNLGETTTYLNGFANAFAQAYDAINNLQRQRTEIQLQSIDNELNRKLQSLDRQEAAELKTATNKEAVEAKYRRKKEQAEKAAHDQEAKLKKKQFEADKKAAIIKAIIGTALAVVSALGTTPFFPLGLIMAVLAGAAGAIEIAAISSQPTPEFKRGGVLNMYPSFEEGGKTQGIIKGASHAEGGIKLVDSKTASVVGEIEGDETILTGEVSKRPDLLKAASDINVKAGGKPFLEAGGILSFANYTPPVYESGTVLGSVNPNVSVQNNIDFNPLLDALTERLTKPLRSYVITGDITQSQNIDAIIERRSKLVA